MALRLVQTQAARESERETLVALAKRIDYTRLEKFLREQRLLPLVGSRLNELAVAVPAGFAASAEKALLESRRHFTFSSSIAARFGQQMESAGIPNLPLKGPGLAERIYRDPAMRSPTVDLDFIVDPMQLDDAVGLFEGIGYTIWDDTKWADDLPHYHYSLEPNHAFLPKVELHWRVHWYEGAFCREVLRSSVLNGELRRAETSADLAILLLIYARDGFVGLRLAADLAAWWDTFGAELDEGALDSIMVEHPALRPALLAALEVSESISALPTAQLSEDRHRQTRRTQTAARLSDWRVTSAKALATDIELNDLLLTPYGAWCTFIRHYYWQPLAHYRRQYGWQEGPVIGNQVRRFGHAIARMLKSTTRYAHRLWSLERGRRRPPPWVDGIAHAPDQARNIAVR